MNRLTRMRLVVFIVRLFGAMQHVEKPLVYTVGDTGFYSVEVETVSKVLYPAFQIT